MFINEEETIIKREKKEKNVKNPKENNNQIKTPTQCNIIEKNHKKSFTQNNVSLSKNNYQENFSDENIVQPLNYYSTESQTYTKKNLQEKNQRHGELLGDNDIKKKLIDYYPKTNDEERIFPEKENICPEIQDIKNINPDFNLSQISNESIPSNTPLNNSNSNIFLYNLSSENTISKEKENFNEKENLINDNNEKENFNDDENDEKEPDIPRELPVIYIDYHKPSLSLAESRTKLKEFRESLYSTLPEESLINAQKYLLPVPEEKKDDEKFKILKMKQLKKKSVSANKSAKKCNENYKPFVNSLDKVKEYSLLRNKKVPYSNTKNVLLDLRMYKNGKSVSFPLYRDSDIGFYEYWEIPLKENTIDEDVDSDDEQIAIAGKVCQSDIKEAIDNIEKYGQNCIHNLNKMGKVLK